MGGHYMPSGALAPLSASKGAGIDIHPLYFTYPVSDGQVDVTIYENDFAAANGLGDLVAAAAADAIARKGSFVIALSGGSLIKSLGALIGREDIDFSRWWVVFSDERNVALSSPDSNYHAAHEELLRKVPIPSSHVLAIKEGLPVDQAAEHYAGRLLDLPHDILPRNSANFPEMDLILLGVGPDGHVASLFPNRKETAVTEGWVLPVSDSPKPPAERITLSMPVLNAARQVAIVAVGQGKAEVVQRALEVQSLPGALPVQLVQPSSGKVCWVLDKPAAGSLAIADWDNTKKFPRST
jgi:6-phosphogluconolactonase